MTVSATAMTEPVAGAMETATAEKEGTGTAAATAATAANRSKKRRARHGRRFFFLSSEHRSSSFQHDHGKTGTSDIHDSNQQQQGLHQSQQQQQQHNPVAIIDTGYYADIVQQPVRVRCSEYYNNGVVSYPIEPCIAVQLHRKVQLDILGSSHNTIQNTSLLVARAYLTSSDGCSDRSYFVRSLEVKVQRQVISDHPLSKPGVPTASLFGSQTTAADIVTGKDGNRGVFFFFPDIGIKVSGQFKLRIVISRMPQE
ncbi:hypothetical protein BASA50_009770 [Batrachochytrium salamandrivorans]|uniref:Velvet domain-containing protein n=1 Tax=Batrachochytrium salamandrivorans TaxID=1357716 RepID=A0ABQ8F395_9FUNG|nr:hypothetical protein BASA50_009770 [Batrachochytrium salamandrivorans]